VGGGGHGILSYQIGGGWWVWGRSGICAAPAPKNPERRGGVGVFGPSGSYSGKGAYGGHSKKGDQAEATRKQERCGREKESQSNTPNNLSVANDRKGGGLSSPGLFFQEEILKKKGLLR